jgi:hypothetical protein
MFLSRFIIIGGLLLTALSVIGGLSIHLPTFLILAITTLIFYCTVNLWWLSDVRSVSQEERNRSLFYIFNYPGAIGEFVAYLFRKHKSSSQFNNTKQDDKKH